MTRHTRSRIWAKQEGDREGPWEEEGEGELGLEGLGKGREGKGSTGTPTRDRFHFPGAASTTNHPGRGELGDDRLVRSPSILSRFPLLQGASRDQAILIYLRGDGTGRAGEASGGEGPRSDSPRELFWVRFREFDFFPLR